MISKISKRFCRDDLSKIENYDKAMADPTQTWHCHHRLETHRYTDRTRTSWEKREEDVSVEMLKAFDLYFDRPAQELIFLPRTEHLSLHHKGKKFSEETRCKISKANKGKKNSDEARRKMSEALKGRKFSEEHKRKISETSMGNQRWLGRHHTEESKRKTSEALKGRQFSEETRRKMSEAAKKRCDRKRMEVKE